MQLHNVAAGSYQLPAIATNQAGVVTRSLPIKYTVGTPPTVTLTGPTDGGVYPAQTNIGLSAVAHTETGSIREVSFYSDGALIATVTNLGVNPFTYTWRLPADGVHSLWAVATDSLGLTTTSGAISIGVNTTVPRPGEFVWFDDTLPVGASKFADGDLDWYWVNANPAPISAHDSPVKRLCPTDAPNQSFHQHAFEARLKVAGEQRNQIFTMSFWISTTSRASSCCNGRRQQLGASGWGENRINYGTNGTNSRRYMGLCLVPAPGASDRARG
jgi:hypothetical protein